MFGTSGMTLQTAQSTASGIIEIPVIRQEVQIPHGGTISGMPHGGRIPHGTAIGRIPHGKAQEKAAVVTARVKYGANRKHEPNRLPVKVAGAGTTTRA